jgi:pimeloyl-ACP methyl ester carboxylesterase
VLGGVSFLRRTDKVRPAGVGIVAQSMGAAGAVLAMAREPDALHAAVALSPPDSTYVFLPDERVGDRLRGWLEARLDPSG